MVVMNVGSFEAFTIFNICPSAELPYLKRRAQLICLGASEPLLSLPILMDHLLCFIQSSSGLFIIMMIWLRESLGCVRSGRELLSYGMAGNHPNCRGIC